MSTPTTHHDVRIVDSFGDGGRLLRRAPSLGAIVGTVCSCVLVALGGPAALWLSPALVAAGTTAGHDVRSGRLPDRLVAATGLLGLVVAVALDDPNALGGFAAFSTGVLGLALPLLLVHLASPCAMAFGDVKFAAAIGGLLGIVGTDPNDRLLLTMTSLSAAGAVAVLGAATVRSRLVPFGPSLFLGTCGTLVVAAITRSPFA